MKTQRTAGPWWAGSDEDGHVVYAEENGNAVEVASTLREDGDGDAEVANARLVAAAPDLLLCCEEFISLYKDGDMHPEDDCRELYQKILKAFSRLKCD